MNMKKKILTLLVLLMTAVTGAWAQEQSETIATTAKIVEGTHFTISNNGYYADGDGMNAAGGITVTSKNGETITKVVISCTFVPDYVNDGNTSVSSGTKEITKGGGTITVTGVNASTFTFTCSHPNPQFGQFVVYYTETPAEPDVEVTTNKAENETTFTEAWFNMPAFDATADYELVRDMAVDMPVTIGDGKDGFRIRVKNVEGKWELDNLTEAQMMAKVTVRDSIEHKNLVFNGDAAVCDAKIYAIDDDGQPTGDAITSATMAPGSYVIIATAKEGSDYDGTTLASNTFLLYDYINITFPKGYSTHYYNESLVLDEIRNSLKFYAVTAVTSEKVTLTEIEGKAIPGGTPFIVYNETAEPITAVMGMLQADDVTSAEQFKGTAEDKSMGSQSNCYILRNGDSTPTFRLVEGAGTLPAHRCYIDLGFVAGTRSLGFDFGDGTTGIDSVESGELKVDSYYDLQGRKHQGTPQRKGVYVKDGRKVIVR